MLYTIEDPSIFTSSHQGERATGQRIKVIRSGDMMEIEIYPYWDKRPKGIRAQKLNTTTTKAAKQNEKNARKNFFRLMHCNFGSRDFYLTVTYEQAPTEAEARKDIRNLLRRIQTARCRAGLCPAKWMYVIEFSEDKQKRIHCHLIVEGGLDRDQLERLWTKGRANCRRLQPDEFGLTGLATYLMKDPKGRKRWGASKGLKRPKVTYRKLTHRQAEKIVLNENIARDLFEKTFAGYRYLDMTPPKWSEYVTGVYAYARMRRIA